MIRNFLKFQLSLCVAFVALVSTLAFTPGLHAQAVFLGQQVTSNSYNTSFDYGIAINSSGTIAVADGTRNTIWRISPTGQITMAQNGPGPNGDDGLYQAVAIDDAGNIYSSQTNTLWKIAPNNSVTSVSLGILADIDSYCQPYLAYESLSACEADAIPTGLAVDPSGNVYVSNPYAAGLLEVPAGGGAPFYMDTSPFEVTPGDRLVCDHKGNLYINDAWNGRVIIMPPGGGTYGVAPPGLNLSGNPGTGAFTGFTVDVPLAIGVDREGNIYVGDANDLDTENLFYQISADGQSYLQMPPAGGGASAIGATDAEDNLAYASNSGQVVRYALQHVDFGNVPVGTTSAPVTLQFALPQGEAINNVSLYSQGFNPNAVGSNQGEFAASGALTCNSASPQICSVPVTFTPSGPGVRSGYAIAYNIVGSGNNTIPSRMARVPVIGTGTGANPVFDSTAILPTTLQISSSVIGTPTQSVTDGAGYTYVVVPAANEVIAVAPGGAMSTVSTGNYTLSSPRGLALDGAGDLYIADTGNNRILEVETITELERNTVFAVGSTTLVVSAPGITLNGPTALATDSLGNVYVANTGNNEVDEISFLGQYLTPGQGTGSVVASGVSSPEGVAVDAARDVYFTNGFDVDELSASTGAITQVLTSPTVSAPGGLALDAGGTLYVADFYNGIVELHTDGSISHTGNNLYGSQSVSVSALGTITVAGPGAPAGSTGTVLLQITRNAPALNFANTTVGNTSVDSPQTVTVSNAGNQPVTFTALTYPTDFPEATSADAACTSAGVLAAGGSCVLPISFEPATAGTFNEAVTFASNTLTSTTAQQSVALTGAGNNGGLSQTIAILNRSQVAANICCGTYGSGGPTFYVTSTSGLPVTLTVLSGPMTFSGSLTTVINTTAGQRSFVNAGNTGAGSGTIMATQAGNSTYAAAAPVTLTYTVNPASTSVRPTSPPASGTQYYGGAGQTLTYLLEGILAKDQVHLVITSGVSAASPVGSYTVTVALAGPSAPNYSLPATTLPFTVTPAPLTVAAVDAYQLVGATPGSFTYTLSGFQNGDTTSVVSGTPTLTTTATASSPAGAYAITVGAGTLAATNYTFTNLANGELNIFAPINLGSANVGSETTQSFSFPTGSAPQASSMQMLTGGSATGAFESNSFQCSAGSCTANLVFLPTAPGGVAGALQMYGGISPANLLVSIPVYGTGVGSQVAFPGGSTSTYANQNNVNGVALDGLGNLYFTEWSNATPGAVYKLAPGGTPTAIGSGWNQPQSIAVDGAGSVYVSDFGLSKVIKITPGGVQTALPINLAVAPDDLALDASGNLYVTVGGATVYKVTPGGAQTLYYQGSAADNYPNVQNMAFSPTGQMYFTNGANGEIYTATQGGVATVYSTAIPGAQAIVFDAAGDIYATSIGQNTMGLYKLTSTGTVTQLISEPNTALPYSLAIDPSGNMYVGNGGQAPSYPGQIIKFDQVDAPALIFPPNTLSVSEGLANIGNQALTFPIPASGINPSVAANFVYNSTAPSACPMVTSTASAAGTLAAGASCNLSVNLSPTQIGTITGSLILTDSNLNATSPYATQTVALSGSYAGSPTITVLSSSANPSIYGQLITVTATVESASNPVTTGTVTFNVDGSSYASIVALNSSGYAQTTIESLKPGSHSITAVYSGSSAGLLASSTSPALTQTVTQATPTLTWPTPAAIPYGTALSATQLDATASVAGNFVYTPPSGTVLSPGANTLSVTFTPYDTTDYNSPTATVNLQVYQLAALTAPTPGTALSGASATFSWTAGVDVSAYFFQLGTKGVGSSNLFNLGATSALSTSVTGLPVNGETLYARLGSKVNGVWQTVDYTYIAASTPAAITSPTPGTALGGADVTFSWSAGSGVTAYFLSVGTTGVGSRNIYNGAATTSLTAAVTGLPTNGATVYVRLGSKINGIWQTADYTYIAAATPAVLTTPAPGTELASANVTFSWTAGVGVTEYFFQLGTKGVGSNNLYNPGATTALSAAVTGLPANGETLYARLGSKINGVWQTTDYTYTAAATPAALTTPAPGTMLSGASVTFSWTAGVGVTEYFFQLGTKGVGSNNLYNPGATTALSASVTGLPANGETLYARLGSKINGVWQTTDYTYTAAATPAALTTPTPGTTLAGASVTFTWTTGAGVSEYFFQLGTKGVGSSNLYNPGATTATSASVTGLPTSGGTIYARLGSKINGVWQTTDYTYTAF